MTNNPILMVTHNNRLKKYMFINLDIKLKDLTCSFEKWLYL